MFGNLEDAYFLKKGQWILYLFIAVVFALFLVPIHELGHVIAGWLSGVPTGMSYAREYTLNGQAETVLGGLGGPIFTVILGYVGIFFIYRRKFLMALYPFSLIMSIDRIFVYLMILSTDIKTFLDIKGLPGMDEKGVAEMLKINPYTFFVIILSLELIAIILILFNSNYGIKKNLFIVISPIITVIPMFYIGINIIERNVFPEQYKMQFGTGYFPVNPLLSSAGIISFLLAIILLAKHIVNSIKTKCISKQNNKFNTL